MRRKSAPQYTTAERVVKGIRRKPRKVLSAEKKIRIMLEGLRGEEYRRPVSGDCVATSRYKSWPNEFLDAGQKRLAGDDARQTASPEVKKLRAEVSALMDAFAGLTLENRWLKKEEHSRRWRRRYTKSTQARSS